MGIPPNLEIQVFIKKVKASVAHGFLKMEYIN
jgi:hypothetical protein